MEGKLNYNDCIHLLITQTKEIRFLVVHRGYNDLVYKSKEVLRTDDLVNAILNIGKLYQSYCVNSIFISDLICMKNNISYHEITAINKLLRGAYDSLGFYFIDNK